jgi:hypothetical protein
MPFVGYSRTRMLPQRICLNVSRANTLDVSLTDNSGRCNVESKNGEQSWQENLCMLVWGNKRRHSVWWDQISAPVGAAPSIDIFKRTGYGNIHQSGNGEGISN